MKRNYLTQVVWLLVLTIGLLLALSLIPPIEINFTTKQIDILSDLRSNEAAQPTTDTPEKNNGYFVSMQEMTAPIDTNTLVMADTMPSTQEIEETQPVITNVKRKDGDITLIEDYSAQQIGLRNLIQAIENRNTLQRPIRIAFLGDSFIEADIFTQNVRALLQDIYGGCGVGYMAMHSDFPGFRRSINQTDKGWNTYNVATEQQQPQLTSLPLQIHRAEGEAYTRLKGVNKLRYIDKWNVSTIGFIAEDSAVIMVKTDSATYTYDVVPDTKAQFITLQDPTALLEVRCSSPNVAFWGTWLDDTEGIAIDNISMRGYSGTTLAQFPINRLQELDVAIPYDLIVLQYGLNRMTASITHYSPYTQQLMESVAHLREAFPTTDILIMGIGDRCQNQDGEIKTMEAVHGMIKAQRNAAIQSQCLFWDCYEAMQQLGGMPAFVENKWASKDYTHINHVGGEPLAQEFVKAFKYAIENSGKNTPSAQPDTINIDQ